jgi:hypothetical protein
MTQATSEKPLMDLGIVEVRVLRWTAHVWMRGQVSYLSMDRLHRDGAWEWWKNNQWLALMERLTKDRRTGGFSNAESNGNGS